MKSETLLTITDQYCWICVLFLWSVGLLITLSVLISLSSERECISFKDILGRCCVVYKSDEWCYCEWNWSFKNLVISSCFYWVDDCYLSVMNSYQLEFCLDNMCFLKCHLIAIESVNMKWWLTESPNKSLSSRPIGTVICIISFVLQ